MRSSIVKLLFSVEKGGDDVQRFGEIKEVFLYTEKKEIKRLQGLGQMLASANVDDWIPVKKAKFQILEGNKVIKAPAKTFTAQGVRPVNHEVGEGYTYRRYDGPFGLFFGTPPPPRYTYGTCDFWLAKEVPFGWVMCERKEAGQVVARVYLRKTGKGAKSEVDESKAE
jgi:hypothetical protein